MSMTLNRRWAALVAAFVVSIAGLVITSPPASADTPAPHTIPALQEWTSGDGSYTFGSGTRIVVDSTYESQLTGDAGVFADDLKSLTGTSVSQVTGSSADVVDGDIFLTLGSTDSQLGNEGYSMTVGSSIEVSAQTDTGVFYGTRSILQMISQSSTIPAGTARDWSTHSERGLMVDVGRKYFTVSWLQNQIKDMAYVKLNYLHLHLSDNNGFRLESTTHPEIVSPDHYTKQEITDLIAFAAKYHVTVVPELDMPGHMNTILKAHEELKLHKADGTTPDGGDIDLSNPASYTLMKDLITEYLPLFSSNYWHLGADEYAVDYAAYPQLKTYAQDHYGENATPKDIYYGFVRWADTIVRAAGKTMRMWNDGITNTVTSANLARSATASSSSNETADLVASKAIDGSSSTRWSSTYSDPQWLQLDLGGTYSFSEVKLSWQAAYGTAYEIQTSDDGSTWTTIYSTTSGSGGTEDLTGLTGSGRYIRVNGTKRATGYGYSLREFEVYGSPIGSDVVIDYWFNYGLSPQQLIDAGHALNNGSWTPTYYVLGGSKPNVTYMYETWNPGIFQGSATVDDSAKVLGSVLHVWCDNWDAESEQHVAAGIMAPLRVLAQQTWGSPKPVTTYADFASIITTIGRVPGWPVDVADGDLALHKNATASSTETTSFPASNAIDGSYDTRWSSEHSDAQWLQVDLGSTHNVSEVKLSWEAAYAKGYEIQTSDDGSSWTTIYSTTTGAGGKEDLTGLTGSGRYIRMNGTARATAYGYSLWEFEVYGT